MCARPARIHLWIHGHTLSNRHAPVMLTSPRLLYLDLLRCISFYLRVACIRKLCFVLVEFVCLGAKYFDLLLRPPGIPNSQPAGWGFRTRLLAVCFVQDEESILKYLPAARTRAIPKEPEYMRNGVRPKAHYLHKGSGWTHVEVIQHRNICFMLWRPERIHFFEFRRDAPPGAL